MHRHERFLLGQQRLFTHSLIGKTMENKRFDLHEHCVLLARNPETNKKATLRSLLGEPPRLLFPGTRLLRRRRMDVNAWLESHVAANVGGQNVDAL